jgi:dCMP deaminase
LKNLVAFSDVPAKSVIFPPYTVRVSNWLECALTVSDLDRRFLILCEEVRSDSYDPHRSVGAVLVGPNREVLSAAANAPPRALGLTREQTHRIVEAEPQAKYFLLEHAERNALFEAAQRGLSARGATLYCSLFPCADCARAIVAAGVVRLVVPPQKTDPDRDAKWLDHYQYAREIFDRASVKVHVATGIDAQAQA